MLTHFHERTIIRSPQSSNDQHIDDLQSPPQYFVPSSNGGQGRARMRSLHLIKRRIYRIAVFLVTSVIWGYAVKGMLAK